TRAGGTSKRRLMKRTSRITGFVEPTHDMEMVMRNSTKLSAQTFCTFTGEFSSVHCNRLERAASPDPDRVCRSTHGTGDSPFSKRRRMYKPSAVRSTHRSALHYHAAASAAEHFSHDADRSLTGPSRCSKPPQRRWRPPRRDDNSRSKVQNVHGDSSDN